MKHDGMLATVTSIVALLAGAVATSTARAQDASASTIVYSDVYKTLIATFPAGYADACEVSVTLNGSGGLCDARVDLVYFYPDGTLGPRQWQIDSSSSTGWSIEPDPCSGLGDQQYALWAAYVDHVNGYLESGPELEPAQIDRYGACWGWWY